MSHGPRRYQEDSRCWDCVYARPTDTRSVLCAVCCVLCAVCCCVLSGLYPLLQRPFLHNLTPAYNPNFPLSMTLMPKKPNPNSQKVVVREMELEKWDTTAECCVLCGVCCCVVCAAVCGLLCAVCCVCCVLCAVCARWRLQGLRTLQNRTLVTFSNYVLQS